MHKMQNKCCLRSFSAEDELYVCSVQVRHYNNEECCCNDDMFSRVR